MTVNLFEGARRLSMLAGIAAIIGTLISLSTYDPRFTVNYLISTPAEAPLLMDEPCPSTATQHHFLFDTDDEVRLSINLCLLAVSENSSGDGMIPYKVNSNGEISVASVYSEPIANYKRQLERRFSVSSDDLKAISDGMSLRYQEHWLTGICYLLAGLTIFTALVYSIGWIVRGFVGIPTGMDKHSN